MWDLESYTKLMWNMPWGPPFGADWVTSHEDGSSRHFAEPRHSTIALTEETIRVLDTHMSSQEDKPLFLYLSYNAAHSPLQPEPEWLDRCSHIPVQSVHVYCTVCTIVQVLAHPSSLAETVLRHGGRPGREHRQGGHQRQESSGGGHHRDCQLG